MMQAAGMGIRCVLRVGGNSVRARAPARRVLQLADSSLPAKTENLGSATRFRSFRWSHAAGAESAGSWSKKLALGTAIAAITALTNSESLCEMLEDDSEEESPDNETVVRRGHCNVCDDDSDNMSIYFDAEYEPKKLLGCGTFGVVMQCVHKQTGRVAAVKMVQEVAGNQEEVEREKTALQRLERAGGHASIVSYEGSYYHNDFHYIVLEYVPGTSLHSFIEKHHTQNATWSLQLVSQLASALQFMHQQDIAHRDLKPENIMVLVSDNNTKECEDVTLKIIDFGCAGRASEPELANTAHLTTMSGTRCYWPPEALERQDMTAAMDMWALGCILYILISGRHPFDLTGCSTEDEIMRRIKAEPVSFLLPIWRDIPAETKELIRGLLEKDPRHRLSADQVLEHPAIIAATKQL